MFDSRCFYVKMRITSLGFKTIAYLNGKVVNPYDYESFFGPLAERAVKIVTSVQDGSLRLEDNFEDIIMYDNEKTN